MLIEGVGGKNIARARKYFVWDNYDYNLMDFGLFIVDVEEFFKMYIAFLTFESYLFSSDQ